MRKSHCQATSRNLSFYAYVHNMFYVVKSNPGVDGVDLLCLLLITHGSRQHRTMAIKMPIRVVIRPEKINTNLYCDASAPGFNWTRPTIRSIAPINMVTTAICNTDICANKSRKYLRNTVERMSI